LEEYIPIVYPFTVQDTGEGVHYVPLQDFKAPSCQGETLVYVDVITAQTAKRIKGAIGASVGRQSQFVADILRSEKRAKRLREGRNTQWLAQKIGVTERTIKHRNRVGKGPKSLVTCIDRRIIGFVQAGKLISFCEKRDIDLNNLCNELLTSGQDLYDFLSSTYPTIFQHIFGKPSNVAFNECKHALGILGSNRRGLTETQADQIRERLLAMAQVI
jgi:hypothetical protein